MALAERMTAVVRALAPLVLTVLVPIPATATRPAAARGERPIETVVVAAPDAPFRPLAREIADAEDSPLMPDLVTAIRAAPEFILWVVAPESLSDPVVVAAARLLADATAPPSLGIITGSSQVSARSLWQRRSGRESTTLVTVRGEYRAHGIEAPRLVDTDGDGNATRRELQGREVTPVAVGAALARAHYLEFRGHGGSSFWRLTSDTVVRSGDVPEIAGTVVDAWGCNTLRPWTEGSLGLAIVDRGAAAYAGFTYSGIAGYGFQDLPLRHTWRGFPVGHVVRLQNAAMAKGYAAFPVYFILGDPRTALRDEPPYRLQETRERARGGRPWKGRAEGITYRVPGAPRGWLPVRIPGGADYRSVRVRTPDLEFLTWDADPLYDGRIQIGDVGRDKLVFVKHDGGDLEIDLLPRAPTGTAVVKTAIGAVDHVWIHLAADDGGILLLIAGAVCLIGLTTWLQRRGGIANASRTGLAAAIAGLVLGGAHAAWALPRIDSVWVSSKAGLSLWPGIVATALFAATGAIALLGLRSRWGRPAGLLLGSLPAWFPALFAVAVVAGSSVIYGRLIGASPYDFAFARPALLGALPTTLLAVTVLLIVDRLS